MLMLYFARLQDGDAALSQIDAMLENLLEANGFIIHPPTRGAPSFDNVYEMDGNTGLCTCIAEMLLLSEESESDAQCATLHLLPALPNKWQSGKVTGLCAVGGVTVDISWENSILKEARLFSKGGKTVLVRYQGETTKISLLAGEKVAIRAKDF
jgi:alpha-L-fucosidase 2